jgi:TMEM175 potassium channel family protein
MSADDYAASDGGSVTAGNAAEGDSSRNVRLVAAERVVFFSDAVVAIAITLLALDLYIPHGNTNAALWHDLGQHHNSYLAFGVSFLVIANHWRAHHRLFADVRQLDERAITLDFGWLLMIIVTPAATRVLTSQGDGAFGMQFTIYSSVQVLTVVFFVLLTRHLRRNEQLHLDGSRLLTTDHELNQIVIAIMFAISIPISYITPYAAFACWAVSGTVARIIQNRSWRNRRL